MVAGRHRACVHDDERHRHRGREGRWERPAPADPGRNARHGAVRVFGGLGKDVLHGGSGADQVDGGGNTDFVYGEGGADKIHGGNGDDVLIGGSGNDILWGDFGGDYLKGGAGVDRFFGGYGNDLIDSRDGLTEHVYCGDGTDRVEADLRDIVNSDCEKVVRRPAIQAPAPR